MVPDQARLMISVAHEKGYGLQSDSNFDSIEFVLENDTLLQGALVKDRELSSANDTATVFTALRPGPGYRLSLLLRENGKQAGLGYVEDITLAPGQINTVNVVVGLDKRLQVDHLLGGAYHAWNGNGHLVVTGDTIRLETGFGTLSPEAIQAAGIASMRLRLTPTLHTGGAVINGLLSQDTGSFRYYNWNTAQAAGTFDPSKLLDTGASQGAITFELLNGSGKIVGRSEMLYVTLVRGVSVDINLIEGGDPKK